MPTRSFDLVLVKVLTANGRDSMIYTIPANEKLSIEQLVFVASGAFNVIGFRDNTGYLYSNASELNPITSTLLQNAANSNRSMMEFNTPIELDGSLALIIDLLDTSAAGNTVRVLMRGTRTTSGGG